MRRSGRGRRPAPLLSVALALTLPGLALAQSPPAAGDFVYRARARDTLIGISRRLLLEPRRWPEVQTLNHIADPRHIPLGDEVRIPYGWLRMSPDTATVAAIGGEARTGAGRINTGDKLAEGSQIQTGPDGSVTLVLADGSVMTLQKSTALTLEEIRHVTGAPTAHDTRMKLHSGRLQTQVKPQGDVGRFEIQTPVAVSAVRGTQFRDAFMPESGSGTTETLEGAVGVSGVGRYSVSCRGLWYACGTRLRTAAAAPTVAATGPAGSCRRQYFGPAQTPVAGGSGRQGLPRPACPGCRIPFLPGGCRVRSTTG